MSDLIGRGANHGMGLPAMDNQSLQVLLGTRLAGYALMEMRYTLPAQLFIEIDMDVNLCDTITYLCEDTTDLPQMQDSALDAVIKRRTISPPKVKTFSGWNKGGFETKIAKEQLECINKSQVLRSWYQRSLMRAVDDGKSALMARFYRYLMVHGVHPKNTGNNAGLISSSISIGTPEQPVRLTKDNIDLWYVQLLRVMKEMPTPNFQPVENEFGRSTENAFLFGPPDLEWLLMRDERYNDWDKMGDCAACSMMDDSFTRMPRGIYHITSRCGEKRICSAGNTSKTVYPVLFGRRYMGTKASMRVETMMYDSLDGESSFFRTTFYHHIYSYDCRCLGLSYVTLEMEQPELEALSC